MYAKSKSTDNSRRAARGVCVRCFKSRANSQSGSSLVELAFLLPLLSLLLLGTIDLGRLAYMSIELASAARAGVQYGQQNISSSQDITGMQAAALNDAPDLVGAANGNLSAVASFLCQCSDGSSVSPGCTTPPSCSGTHMVNYVKVVTSATFKPWIPYPGIPSSLPMNGLAVMRAGQ
ncbi:MAG: TadE/TadG family type IV pilus assembly protein [Candidatus Acidiferrales bacterium]